VHQEIEVGGHAVGEGEPAGRRVDLRHLVLGVVRDALRLDHLPDGSGHVRSGDAHRSRLRGVQLDGDLLTDAAPPAVVLEQHRRLVRRRRALVGRCGRHQDEPPGAKRGQRVTQALGSLHRAEVVARVREAGDDLGREVRAERDHHVVALERSAVHLYTPVRGIDGGDRAANDLDASPAEAFQRSRDLLRGPGARHEPQERWGEDVPLLAVDEHDAVVGRQLLAKLDCGHNTADTAAEHEDGLVHDGSP
jgi:hypothetical protein